MKQELDQSRTSFAVFCKSSHDGRRARIQAQSLF